MRGGFVMGELVDAFDAHRAEVEYRVAVPSNYTEPPEGEPKLEVGISAVGGGTVGKQYVENGWLWGLWADGSLIASGDDLRCGATPATHDDMARTLCAFLSYDGECINYGPGSGPDDGAEEGRAYTQAAWDVLGAEHERLAMCHHDGFDW